MLHQHNLNLDCLETFTCHIRGEAFFKSLCFFYSNKEKEANNLENSNSNTVFTLRWLEEGLTSCYKNIFVFITVVELQDKFSVQNTAPTYLRFNATSTHCLFTPFVSFILCPRLSLLTEQAATKWLRTEHVILKGSVAGTFWVLSQFFFQWIWKL